MRRDLRTWFAVDTLEFLRRGGRIGSAQAYLGSALKIKPILTLGKEIEPIERVRTAGRAMERLKEYLAQRQAEGCDEFAVQHIQDRGRAEELVEAGRAIYGREPLFVSEVGPVIGTHVGPGLLGVSGVRSALLRPG
jgi:DegV family protein with EDD domain